MMIKKNKNININKQANIQTHQFVAAVVALYILLFTVKKYIQLLV